LPESTGLGNLSAADTHHRKLPMNSLQAAAAGQTRRNKKLLADARYLGERVTSKVLPLQIDVAHTADLSQDQVDALEALQIEAARTSIGSLA
jgi:hypothetical protein